MDKDGIFAKAKTGFSDCWVSLESPDYSASSDANDYQHQVLQNNKQHDKGAVAIWGDVAVHRALLLKGGRPCDG
jgi:hypothetical protein